VPTGARVFATTRRASVSFEELGPAHEVLVVRRFVVLVTGESVVPLFRVPRPHYGTFGVYTSQDWNEPTWHVSDRQDYIELPVDPEISKYIIVVRRPSEETSWRVLEVDPKDVWKDDVGKVRLPDIQKLPSMNDRSDSKSLEKMFGLADEFCRSVVKQEEGH
jgi:hypothetical protein